MKEIHNGKNLPIYEQVAESMGRYQKLLDHHKIKPELQEAVWGTVYKQFEDNPTKMIDEVQGYWDSTFGTNGARKDNYNSETNGSLAISNGTNRTRIGAKAALNKWRLHGRNESFKKRARKFGRKEKG